MISQCLRDGHGASMPGFDRFRNGATAGTGVESMHRIRKGQLRMTACTSKMPPIPTGWNAALTVQYGILICFAYCRNHLFASQPSPVRGATARTGKCWCSLLIANTRWRWSNTTPTT